MKTYEEMSRDVLKRRDEELIKMQSENSDIKNTESEKVRPAGTGKGKFALRIAVPCAAVLVVAAVGAGVWKNMSNRGAIAVSGTETSQTTELQSIDTVDAENNNDISEYNTSRGAVKWFDALQGDELIVDDAFREITLNEYPDVAFRCDSEKVVAATEEETISLYSGMPILSVYFSDLTGDGKPELCSTISVGSGICDTRIIVYDYAAGKSYELSDRMKYDYRLNMKDNKLVVEKYKYMQNEILSEGELVINGSGLEIVEVIVTCISERPDF